MTTISPHTQVIIKTQGFLLVIYSLTCGQHLHDRII